MAEITNNPYLNNVGQIDSEIEGLVVVTSEDGYYGVPSDNINVTVDPNQKSIKAELVQTQYASKQDFPETGSEKLIYVDKSDNSLWRYDSSEQDYIEVSSKADLTNYYTKQEVDNLFDTRIASKTQVGGVYAFYDDEGDFDIWLNDPMEVNYTYENGVYDISTLNFTEQNGIYNIGGNE